MAMSSDAQASPFRSADDRAQDRERKREAVLLTAVELFNERGFKATSLDDVAARLGVTKPAIYHYFTNKEQVLFHCVQLGIDRLHQAITEARRHPGTGRERLRAFLVGYGEIMTEGFGKCIVRTGDHELSPKVAKEFRALKGEIDQALRLLLQEGRDDGSLAVRDVRLTAFALAGALNWIAQWYDPGGLETPSQVAGGMVDILLTGITP